MPCVILRKVHLLTIQRIPHRLYHNLLPCHMTSNMVRQPHVLWIMVESGDQCRIVIILAQGGIIGRTFKPGRCKREKDTSKNSIKRALFRLIVHVCDTQSNLTTSIFRYTIVGRACGGSLTFVSKGLINTQTKYMHTSTHESTPRPRNQRMRVPLGSNEEGFP